MPPAVPRCVVCSNARRAAIEAAVALDGASIIDVAQAFGVTKAALAKHVATHANLPRPSAAAPKKAKVVKGKPDPAEARVDQAGEKTPSTAREHIEDVLRRIRLLAGALSEVTEADGMVLPLLPRDQAVFLTAEISAIKVLGQLTGELGASEATVHASPHWKKLQAELVDALRPYPEALRAVAARLERIERSEAA